MVINEITKLVNETIGIAGKFIPKDLSERMANRMEDAERASSITPEAAKVIRYLMEVPDITPASSRDLKDSRKECIFGGWVGWIHNKGLREATKKIGDLFATYE